MEWWSTETRKLGKGVTNCSCYSDFKSLFDDFFYRQVYSLYLYVIWVILTDKKKSITDWYQTGERSDINIADVMLPPRNTLTSFKLSILIYIFSFLEACCSKQYCDLDVFKFYYPEDLWRQYMARNKAVNNCNESVTAWLRFSCDAFKLWEAMGYKFDNFWLDTTC